MHQALPILKLNDERQVVSGWAMVIEKHGLPVVDHQGDVIDADELQRAVQEFMTSSRIGGVMHARGPDGRAIKLGQVIGSTVYTHELQKTLGIHLDLVGWWVDVHVPSKPVFQLCKRRVLPAFSIGGSGIRQPLEIERWAA